MITILVAIIVVGVVVVAFVWAASSRLRYHVETPKHAMSAKVRRVYGNEESR